MIVKQFCPNIIIILRTFYSRLYGGIVVKNVRTRMYHFSDSHLDNNSVRLYRQLTLDVI